MRFKLVQVILGISLSTSALSAHAIQSITCDDCTITKRQTQSRAKGNGDYYFWDFKNRRVYHMNVSGGGDVPLRVAAAPSRTKVGEIMLTGDEQAMVNAGFQLYDMNGGSPTVQVELPVYDRPVAFNSSGIAIAASSAQLSAVANEPGTSPMNAMDAVTTPALREEAIAKTLSYNNLGPFTFVRETLRVVISGFSQAVNITKLPTPFSIVNKIPFPDGSFITVRYTYQDHDYRYIPGSGRDAAGNVIPDTQKDVVSPDQGYQAYVYPTSAFAMGAGDDMLKHLTNLGVRWIGSNSPPRECWLQDRLLIHTDRCTMPSKLPNPVEGGTESHIHGNGILFRAFLILTVSAGMWMMAGLLIGRGAQGALVWPYIIPSLVGIALIVAYRARVRNATWFTNKPRTLFLLTLSWIACAIGIFLSVVPS